VWAAGSEESGTIISISRTGLASREGMGVLHTCSMDVIGMSVRRSCKVFMVWNLICPMEIVGLYCYFHCCGFAGEAGGGGWVIHGFSAGLRRNLLRIRFGRSKF
jgi:hypothetical protein